MISSVFKAAAAGLALLMAGPVSATVVSYTDEATFLAALGGTPVVEVFGAAAIDFADNSTGNAIGSGMTVDVNGATGDVGLTGLGQLKLEVDGAAGDLLSVTLNFTNALLGFGFVIQNDSQTNTAGVDLEEIGISIGGSSLLLSDVAGLTTSSNGAFVSSVENTAPVFFGFSSATAFSSITFLHGALIAPGGVPGSLEQFFLNSATLVPASSPPVTAIPLPGGLPLLLTALGGFFWLRRRQTG
jgi:hypothetical protein